MKTDLQMIEMLERHIGFLYNRLTCDGNIYAQKIKLSQAHIAFNALANGCLLMRHALVGEEDNATKENVQKMLNSYDNKDYIGFSCTKQNQIGRIQIESC